MITIRLDVFHHFPGKGTDSCPLQEINQKLDHMAQELDDLKAAVAAETEVTQSAIALLNGLKAKLDAAIAAGDPAALKALSDSLGKDTTDLAAAVTANTPSET